MALEELDWKKGELFQRSHLLRATPEQSAELLVYFIVGELMPENFQGRGFKSFPGGNGKYFCAPVHAEMCKAKIRNGANARLGLY